MARDDDKESSVAEQWEHIGDACVDSGRLQIVDPCYAKEKWDQLGVCLSPGFGDGVYPVMVRRYRGDNSRWGIPAGHPGRIAEIRIVCIDDSEET